MPESPRGLDAAALLDASSWTTYQKLLTALAAMAIIIDGFDIQILAFTIPSLMEDWHVPRDAFAPVLAVGLAGMGLGGPLFGYWGDRFGRKTALLAALVLFGLATAATALVHSVAALAALRFITGLGAGGAVPNAGSLAAEFAPLNRRSAAVKLTLLCVPLGGMLGGLIAARVLPAFGWPALYWIGGITPLVFAAFLAVLLPESPRFMAGHPAQWPKLAAFLRRAGHTLAPDATFLDAPHAKAQRVSVTALFERAFARDTLGLWTAFFGCMSGVYLVFGWLPALLRSQGLTLVEASGGLALYNFGGVAGVLVWAVLLTLYGSRKPLLWATLGGAITALLTWQTPPAFIGLALAAHGFLVQAAQVSLFALAAHVYPTRVRATGIAWSAALGRVGGIASSLAGAAIIGYGPVAFWLLLVAVMLGAAAGLMTVTRHTTREG